MYEVTAANKILEIWQRDPLSIEIYSREVARQKLDYIHFNPVGGKWKLAKDDLAWYYSSARFYETGVDNPIAELDFCIICMKCLMEIDNKSDNLTKGMRLTSVCSKRAEGITMSFVTLLSSGSGLPQQNCWGQKGILFSRLRKAVKRQTV